MVAADNGKFIRYDNADSGELQIFLLVFRVFVAQLYKNGVV